jgi:hypothetical protein
MKVEWWYDDANYHLDKTRVFLARLTIRDDGSAQLITDGQVHEFENEDEASIWLADEEYSVLEMLVEDLREQGIPVDPRLESLVFSPEEDSEHSMVLVLKASEGEKIK